jgi:hypothetical protein
VDNTDDGTSITASSITDTSMTATSTTATLERPTRAERAVVVAATSPGRSANLTVLGLVWAVALVAVGAVGIHDGLVETGAVDPWIDRVIPHLDGLRPDREVLAVAAVAGLLGLVLLVVAVWPRRRRRVALYSQAGVSLRQRHLERLLKGWMESRDGVLRCDVEARGRTVSLEVRGVDGADPAELYGGVISTARDEVGILVRRPDLQLLVREVD